MYGDVVWFGRAWLNRWVRRKVRLLITPPFLDFAILLRTRIADVKITSTDFRLWDRPPETIGRGAGLPTP
jgi:hypothetical protein